MGDRLNLPHLLFLWSERGRSAGYTADEIEESLDYAVADVEDANKVRRLRRAGRLGLIWPPEQPTALDEWLYDLIRRALADGWRRDEVIHELDDERFDVGIPALLEDAARASGRRITSEDVERVEVLTGRPFHPTPRGDE